MIIEQRDILLVPFPFTNQSGNKVRPVLVLSKNDFNQKSEDIIVSGITSNITKEDHSVRIENKDFEQGHLFETSSIKVENILKIEKSLVVKKIGKIKKETFRLVLEKMYQLFE